MICCRHNAISFININGMYCVYLNDVICLPVSLCKLVVNMRHASVSSRHVIVYIVILRHDNEHLNSRTTVTTPLFTRVNGLWMSWSTLSDSLNDVICLQVAFCQVVIENV